MTTPDADREIVELVASLTRAGTRYTAGHQFKVRLSTATRIVAVDSEGRRVTLCRSEVRTIRKAVLLHREPAPELADLVADLRLIPASNLPGVTA